MFRKLRSERTSRGLRAGVVAVVVAAFTLAVAAPARATIADKRNDFNGDGISDLLAVSYNDCLYRWNGNGSGGLSAGVAVNCSGWYQYAEKLASPGDINRDGKADLVGIRLIGDPASPTDACLYRWYGDGRGGFGAGAQVGCGWRPYGAVVGAGDLNNDGNGDLVAIRSGGCLVRWLGNGAGGFPTATQLGCGWDDYNSKLTGAGDLNGDGNADLVGVKWVGAAEYCLSRWYGNGSGGFGNGVQVGCGWRPYRYHGSLSGMGDLDGDGVGDLVAIDVEDDCLDRWLGNGNGGYRTSVRLGCNAWTILRLVP